jgi:hypothetical protein
LRIRPARTIPETGAIRQGIVLLVSFRYLKIPQSAPLPESGAIPAE